MSRTVPHDLPTVILRFEEMQRNLETLAQNTEARTYILQTYDAYMTRLSQLDKTQVYERCAWLTGYKIRHHLVESKSF